jgi:hypothetical protein
MSGREKSGLPPGIGRGSKRERLEVRAEERGPLK